MQAYLVVSLRGIGAGCFEAALLLHYLTTHWFAYKLFFSITSMHRTIRPDAGTVHIVFTPRK
jgi:hypothetical protein